MAFQESTCRGGCSRFIFLKAMGVAPNGIALRLQVPEGLSVNVICSLSTLIGAVIAHDANIDALFQGERERESLLSIIEGTARRAFLRNPDIFFFLLCVFESKTPKPALKTPKPDLKQNRSATNGGLRDFFGLF